jgi:glycosyltransferase involved in cell wall biosynthesis
MKISIITVVFNSEAYIRATIENILAQDFPNLEFIVVDGKSTDATMSIVEEYKDRIDIIVSEPDKGIYDAMNKGLRLATGDYVLFINSGDKLSSSTILSDILSFDTDNLPDVVYGDTEITDSEGNILHSRRHRPPENLSWKDFKKGMLVCHQAFIAKRSLCTEYNTNYRYAADFDWCINILKKASSVYNTHKVIALFMDGGQTKKTIVPGLKERFRIMCTHYGKCSAIFANIKLGFKFAWWRLWHKWF